MKNITAKILTLLSALVLFSCSVYDSSEIEGSITDLENRIAALEEKADGLTSQLKSVSDFVNANFISRVGTDEKGNYVITYKTAEGETKTVTLAKASDVNKTPIVSAGEFEGKMYWRQTSDNGASYEWIVDKEGNKMPVETSVPVMGVDKDGYWMVNGVRTDVLAKDVSDSLFSSVEADSETGLVKFTLADGSVFSVTYLEALSISFSTPRFVAIEDYATPVTIGYTVEGTMAEDAVVDFLTAYNVDVKVNENMKTLTVSMKDGQTEGNTVIMATAGEEVVYKPLFFSYGAPVMDFESYIKENELITPMGDPVIKLNGQMTTFTINVSHNIDIQAVPGDECSSWLKPVRSKALETSQFDFVAEYFESKSNTPRTGSIILTNSLYEISTVIAVSQSPIVIGGGGSDDPSADKGISDVNAFLEFVKSVNAGASTSRWENAAGEVNLLADINLAGVEWTPIGSAEGAGAGIPSFDFVTPFSGKFNGNGHSIVGINWTCDMTKNNVFGLFGAAKDAEIKNFVLGGEGDVITIIGTPDVTPVIAAVVGYAEGTTISGVTNNVSIVFETGDCPQAMPMSLAGIVGGGKDVIVGSKVKAEGVRNNGDILVKPKVSNAQAGGTGLQTAGIMAYVLTGKDSQFINCTNTGHITGPNGRGGGILASIQGTESAGNKVTVSNCTNSGLIEDNYMDHAGYTNAKRMGGLVGGTEAANVTIESCKNLGNVFSHTGCRCGGFVGHFKGGIITGCSNSGIILSHITAKSADGSGGDGPGWAAGYCNLTIVGCTCGGKVGEWATCKDNPESAPDADNTNAYGYRNSSYFKADQNL